MYWHSKTPCWLSKDQYSCSYHVLRSIENSLNSVTSLFHEVVIRKKKKLLEEWCFSSLSSRRRMWTGCIGISGLLFTLEYVTSGGVRVCVGGLDLLWVEHRVKHPIRTSSCYVHSQVGSPEPLNEFNGVRVRSAFGGLLSTAKLLHNLYVI